MKKESTETSPSTKFGAFIRSVLVMFTLLIVISITVWISFFQFRLPQVLPLNIKSDQFSAMNALKYLENFAKIPHPLGSEEHDRVRDYLMTTLTNLGVSPQIQKVDSPDSAWGVKYNGQIENILARIPGKDSSGAIMVSAHYDTVEGSAGAADDGSSVASILETVRILMQSSKLKNDIIILITDGEESGLLGAQAFVKFHPWAEDVRLALNFEARGSGGPSILFETNSMNGTLVNEFIKSVPNPIAHSFIYDLYKFMPNDTDLTVFKNAGMYGLNFAFFEGLNAYHTSNDNIEALSLNSLQHHGENMTSLVQHFGNMNLIDSKPEKIVFFNLFGKNVITYSEKIVLPIMIIIILAYILTFIHGYFREKLSFKGTFIGFLIFLFTITITYILGSVLWKVLLIFNSENTLAFESDLKLTNPLFVFFIGVIFIMISVLYRIFSLKIGRSNFAMGAYFSWLMLVVITSVFFKGSSYIFVWPLFFALIGLNIQLIMKGFNLIINYMTSIGFIFLTILLTAPILYLIYVLLSLNNMGLLLGLVSLLSAFIIPAIDISNLRVTRKTNRKREISTFESTRI